MIKPHVRVTIFLSEELQKELSKITNWFKNERARKNIKRDGGTPGKKSPEGKVSL